MSNRLITVHGTWGRRSAWAKPSGPLATLVKRECPDVQVDAFEWRGGNRHSDRIAAAKELAQRLVDLADDNVVIVAHSHGGNIARSASALAGKSSNHRAIVTLGTPFITCDHRRNPELAELADAAFGVGGTALVLALASRGKGNPPVKVPAWVTPPAWGLLAISAVWLGVATTTKLLARELSRHQIADLIDIVDPPQAFAEIVILATPADEASLALAAAQLIGFATSRTTDVLATVTPILTFSLLAGGLGSIVARSIRHRHNLNRVYKSSPVSLVLPEALLGLGLVPALLLDWIDRLCSGWDGAGLSGRRIPGSNRWVRVSLTPVPAGRHATTMIRQESQTHAGPLAHALLTSDANVVREVAAAIVTRFRRAQPNR
jgi:hypothetical protein